MRFKLNEGITNIPKIDNAVTQVPVVMAKAKEDSDKLDEIVKDTFTDDFENKDLEDISIEPNRPITAKMKDIETVVPKTQDMKDMKLAENMQTEAYSGECSDKLYSMIDDCVASGDINCLSRLAQNFVAFISEQDACEFLRLNGYDDKEDIEEVELPDESEDEINFELPDDLDIDLDISEIDDEF